MKNKKGGGFNWSKWLVLLALCGLVFTFYILLFNDNCWGQVVQSDVSTWVRSGNLAKLRAVGDSGIVINHTDGDVFLIFVDSTTDGSDPDTVYMRNNEGVLEAKKDGNTTWYNLIDELKGTAIGDLSGITTNHILKWDGDSWELASDETADAGSGDIDGVTAGNGLTGGGTSGTVTVDVGAGTGITVGGDDVAVNTTWLDGVIDTSGVEMADTELYFRNEETAPVSEGLAGWHASGNYLMIGKGGSATDTIKSIPDSATTVKDDGITMAKIHQSGASTNQVIAWNGSDWAPADQSGSGTTVETQFDGTQIEDATEILDFQDGFDYTHYPATGEVEIDLDLSENPCTLTTDVTGTLPVTNGGTGASSFTGNQVLTVVGGVVDECGAMSNGQVLIGRTGNVPLPATLTDGGAVTVTEASGSITFGTDFTADKIELGTADQEVNGALTVTNGGTGLATLTDGSVLVGNGTSTVEPVAMASTYILVGQGGTTTPSAVAMSGDVTMSAAGVTTISNNAVAGAQVTDGSLTYDDMGQDGATTGQVPEWDGDSWEPATPSADVFTAVDDSLLYFIPISEDTALYIRRNTTNDTTQIEAPDGGVLIVGTDGTVATIDSAIISGNYFPVDSGTNGYQLTTDGAGALSWAAAGGASAGTQDTVIFNIVESAAGTEYSSIGNRLKVRPGSGVTISREDSTDFDLLRIAATLGTAIDLTAEVGSSILPAANGGTGAATLTDHGVVLGSGTGAVTVTSAPTTGQFLIGNTGYDPGLAVLSGDVASVSAAGAVTLANDCIDETHIADDGIDSEHYNDGSIDNEHIAAQTIDKTRIDTTSSNFVFDDAYKVTSAESDSLLSTEYTVKLLIEDSLDEYSLTSAIEALIEDSLNEYSLTSAIEALIEDSLNEYSLTTAIASLYPDTAETVDTVQAMIAAYLSGAVTGNTETGIEVTYQSDTTIDFVVSSDIVAHTLDSAEVMTIVKDTLDHYLVMNIPDPNAYYAIDHEWVMEPITERALTITRIDVTCDADPDTELDFDLKWADAFIGLANAAVIDEMNTTAGVTTITSGFDDATVAASKCIYILFNAEPDENITQVIVKVTFDYD